MDEATRNIVRAMPPGFRFQPSDEELLVHYLRPKAESNPLPASIIADLHICQYDPWDLPAKAIYGEQEWYFFSSRERKYPNGSRPNRVAISGFWKAIGTDKPITASPPNSHIKLGVKKTLVFFKGRPPTGIKTDWIMHEYRLTNIATTPTNTASSSSSSFGATQSLRLDGWVLCRIYKKQHASSNCSRQQPPSNVEEMLERLPDISDMPIPMNMFFGVDTNSLFANDKCNV